MNNELREKIDDIMDKYSETPFLHNGRSIKDGVDCLGFIKGFYSEFGIIIPNDDGRYIDEDWFKFDADRLVKNLKKIKGTYINYRQLKILDMAFFAVSRNIITHLGVIVDDNKFAHTSPNKNLIISRLEGAWGRRFRGAVRLKEIEVWQEYM